MSTLLRSNLPDLNLESALPFIEKVIEEQHESYPFVSEQIFNIRDMKYGIAQHAQVSALSPAAEVGEGSEIPQDKIRQGYSTTFKSRKYGILLSSSQESIDHDRFDTLSKNPAKMGRSMATTREIEAAKIFNNAFTATGSDGKALCATDHPLLASGAGSSSNRLAVDADLSVTSLKDMITVFKKQLDTAGNKLMIKPKYLLVPSELEYTAFELLHSAFLPGGSENNVNSVGPDGLFGIKPICWEYLSDADAWFLLGDASDTELYWFWDKRPEVKSSMEFKTDVALTRMLARFTVGYSDWRGVCGTPGA